MRVNSIRCNNILSFQPERAGQNNLVTFGDPKQLGGAVDILIGPNGSGKTNFIRIVKYIFNSLLIYPASYHPTYANSPEQQHKVFSIEQIDFDLQPHWSFTDHKQEITLDLILTETDNRNILQLRNNKKLLSNIIKNYSTIHDIQPTQWMQPQHDNNHIIRVTFTNNNTTWECNMHDCNPIIRDYIRYRHVFKYALTFIQTHYPEQQFPPFCDLLTVMHADRTYEYTQLLFDQDSGDTHHQSIQQQLSQTRKELIKLLNLDIPIFQEVKHLLQAEIDRGGTLAQLPRLQQMNQQMNSIIHYKLTVDTSSLNSTQVVFEDQLTGQIQSFEQLGGGEKTIIHFLFELYGRGLRDSLMIIDEPEIHLHPHLQQKFLKLLHTTSKQRGMQYLVSTHSPFFVSHETITNLIRFQKNSSHKDSYTRVFKPTRLSIKEKNLITALDYNVAGNIFFVEKAILVEGPDDHYFFEHLIDDRSKEPTNQNTVKRYGIFQLNGKHLFAQFKKFLAQYGLETFYIGDRDNIENILHIDYTNYWSKLKKRKKRGETHKLKHHYAELVSFIKQENPSLYLQIISNIEQLYQESIYILKQGSIESYVASKKKGFEYMIEFCDSQFEHRKHNRTYDTKRAELYTILEKIFFTSKPTTSGDS